MVRGSLLRLLNRGPGQVRVCTRPDPCAFLIIYLLREVGSQRGGSGQVDGREVLDEEGGEALSSPGGQVRGDLQSMPSRDGRHAVPSRIRHREDSDPTGYRLKP